MIKMKNKISKSLFLIAESISKTISINTIAIEAYMKMLDNGDIKTLTSFG